MIQNCICYNPYAFSSYFFNVMDSTKCDGQSVQSVSQKVISSNSNDIQCKNYKAYGYSWTIHGAQRSGSGYCGQLSYSVTGFDYQIYYCILTNGRAVTSVQNDPSKKSSSSIGSNGLFSLSPTQINSYLGMQGSSQLSTWQAAAFTLLSSFAQATGLPIGS